MDALLKPDPNLVQQEALNVAATPITGEKRKETLDLFLKDQLGRGGKIQMKADFEATIIRKRRVPVMFFLITNLLVMPILGFISLGLVWVAYFPILVIWLAVLINRAVNREVTQTVGVDERGFLYALRKGRREYIG